MIIASGKGRWFIKWKWLLYNRTPWDINLNDRFMYRCLRVFKIENTRTVILVTTSNARWATFHFKDQNTVAEAQDFETFNRNVCGIYVALSTDPEDKKWPELAFLQDEFRIASVALFHELVHCQQDTKRGYHPVRDWRTRLNNKDEDDALRKDRRYAHLIHTGGLPQLLARAPEVPAAP